MTLSDPRPPDAAEARSGRPTGGADSAVKVVALDPGGTTGYAQGIIVDGKMTVVTGQHKFDHKSLWTHLEWAKPDIVICERFDFRRRARPGLDLIPRELIGVVELFTQQREITLHMQTPAQAKGYYTDRRLKQDHLYKMNKPHANDAARHILYWFVFGPGFKYNRQGYEAGS